MGDLEVDLDGLDRLGSALRRIDAALGRARSELRGAGDALGDGDVVEAVERFEDRWRDGREDLREDARTLATMLEESSRTYRDADRRLADGLEVGG